VQKHLRYLPVLLSAAAWLVSPASATAQNTAEAGGAKGASIASSTLTVTVARDGSYTIGAPGVPGAILHSAVGADIGSHPLKSSQYPDHRVEQTSFQNELGSGTALRITYSGLANQPDLITTIRLYHDQPFGDIQVSVRNGTGHAVEVQAIHSVSADEGPVVNLNGPASAARVLSDSLSEDRPQMSIRDMADAPDHVHCAVGSQLIYNRQSGMGLFLGALTSDKFLTIFHLREAGAGSDAHIVSYDAEAAGTTELLRGESLKNSPPEDQMDLTLPVEPNQSLSSERLMFAAGPDYHALLEAYGRAVRLLHKARVDTPTPIGWWSWTAYYFGLTQGSAVTNAAWLSENLKQSGYTYYQIDEGYQYARGEYMTSDAGLFPQGMGFVGDRVRHYGLRFGVWTAPFEVSERAWVFEHHKDWLVHNMAGQPLRIGHVTEGKDQLYVLDTTNPGAQEYLRQTYRTLKNEWGVRFIKMDFMEDSAVEGKYYKPHTTGLEAQRIGLQIIRDTVGDDVVLDKDGSPMLNPVGIVDAGRISQDTGHTFGATRDAATGVAARYYMNRNFFVADPDAFTVSKQTVDDQSWHGGQHPLTLDEAKASIALSAVSGGMFEIGDDLPTLGESADRLALVKNADLVNMARLGRASVPMDLMTYEAADLQPSVFLLKESARQCILTVFNWSEAERHHRLMLADFGMKGSDYSSADLFDGESCCSASKQSGALDLTLPPHSARMIKLVDNSVAAQPPAFDVHAEQNPKAGETLRFSAETSAGSAPAVVYTWDFGDGVSLEGAKVSHAYTHPGDFRLRVTATGVDGLKGERTMPIQVNGAVSTRFLPGEKRRLQSR
jgi:alpha-galactosidase